MAVEMIGPPKKEWMAPQLTIFGNVAEITGGDKGSGKLLGLSDGYLLNGHEAVTCSVASSCS